jgi:hypothetical protein
MKEVHEKARILARANNGTINQYKLDIETHQQVSIAGVVTDSITGYWIVNAWVEVVELNLQTQTAEDGSFFFIDLPVGSYTLEISVPRLGTRYGTKEQNVTLSTAANRTLTSVDVQLVPTSITGQVTDKNTKQAIANALVQLLGSEIQALTNSQGQYVIFGIPVCKPTVQVSAQNYQTSQSQPVQLSQGKGITVDFSLVPQTQPTTRFQI